MNEPIKSRIDFDSLQRPNIKDNYQPSQHVTLSGEEEFHPVEFPSYPSEKGETEHLVQSVFKPRSRLWRRMLGIGGLGLIIILLIQGGVRVYQAWEAQRWIELGFVLAVGLIILAGIGALVEEWRRLWRLRQQAEVRDMASDLLNSHGIGQGKAFCLNLLQQARLHPNHPDVQRWLASLHETHSDREIVTLYAKLVQPTLDRQARSEISSYAVESTLMIAISPLALVDMALIAWRNLRLINRIAALYGIELGYFSRVSLFRLVLFNMAVAGGTDLVREVGMDWLSQDLAARLSLRAAQGIGAGLLTARLGIKAMELCRPLPWLSDDKPRLSDFRSELIIQLKKNLPKKKPNDTHSSSR